MEGLQNLPSTMQLVYIPISFLTPWESIGLVKKFIWVFGNFLQKNLNKLFWPAQYLPWFLVEFLILWWMWTRCLHVAKILEGVAISFFRGSSWPKVWNCGSCIGRQILYHLSHLGSPMNVIDMPEIPWGPSDSGYLEIVFILVGSEASASFGMRKIS